MRPIAPASAPGKPSTARKSTNMRWTRHDTAVVSLAWILLAGFIVLVCVLLPTPPEVAGAPRLTSAMLDFFFGAVAIALAVGVITVGLTVWFVARAGHEAERLIDERITRAAGRSDPHDPPSDKRDKPS